MRFPFLLLILFVASLPGCKVVEPDGPAPPPIARRGELPSYATFVERYNANIAGLDRLWARADVTLRYKDEKGKWRSERGDSSTLLIEAPDRVALSVGGIAQALWIGGNEERYWVFHLREEKPAFVGKRALIGSNTTRALPSPVYPHQLPWMLGIVPLDPAAAGEIEWHDGYYLVEPPGTNTRMLIDPHTTLPVRIDMLDALGRSTLAVRLHEPVQVEQAGIVRPTSPTIASHIEAWVLGEDTHVTLKLRQARDGEGNRAIERAFTNAFNFDRLVAAHQPGEIIDLDEPRERDQTERH